MAKREKTGGRKKGTPNAVTAQVRAAAGKKCAEAIRILMKLAKSEKTDAKVRHDCCETILAYGAGKPVEMHEHSGPDGDPIPVSVDVYERIKAVAGRLARRLETKESASDSAKS